MVFRVFFIESVAYLLSLPVFAALFVHVFLGRQLAGRHEGQTEDG